MLETAGYFGSNRTLVVANCDWLVASNRVFVGLSQCSNSRAALWGCGMQGVSFAAFRQTGGSVQMVDCIVQGHIVGSGTGGTAIELQGGDLRLSDSTVVQGGYPILGPGTVGRCFTGTGSIRLDPSTQLNGATPLVPASISSVTVAMPHLHTANGLLAGRTCRR